MKFNKLILAFREVYAIPLYFFISIITATLLITFYIGAINYKYYFGFPKLTLAASLFFGTFWALPMHAVIMLIIASILTGILTSMLAYHIKFLNSINESSSVGALGAILGLVAPACASCGIGFIAILGLSGIISALPFRGVEISIIGIFLLLYAIFSISIKIADKTCNMPSMNNN